MTGEVLHSWAKDAQELIDKLMSERQEWKCSVGGEIKITREAEIALLALRKQKRAPRRPNNALTNSHENLPST